MESNKLLALIVGSILGISGISAYAAVPDDQATKDENTVVGACMIQKFKANVPPITEDTVNKCADADPSAAPKCLGLTNDQYMSDVKFCITQLNNAKCVSAKMKTKLIDYADCGYEKNPAACYKALGFTIDQIAKLSADCQKPAT